MRLTLGVGLAVVLVGLGALALKVGRDLTLAFVLRRVSTFALFLLGFCSIVPWDRLIAEVNLNHAVAHEIDTDHYLALNPQAYPLLYEKFDRIEYQMERHSHNEQVWTHYRDPLAFRAQLDRKREAYLEKRKQYSFMSWSWADARAEAALKALP